MSKRKILIIMGLSLGISVLIVGAILGVNLYLKIQNPTYSWNLYEDKFYGYLIKYPKNWFLYPDEIHKPGYPTHISSFDVEKYVSERGISGDTEWPSISGELNIHITLMPGEKPKDVTLRDWLKDNLLSEGEVKEITEIAVSDSPGIKIVTDRDVSIFVLRGNTVFIIYPEPIESLKSEHGRIFNLMLSTFKFIE
jgi:hypothetical protein